MCARTDWLCHNDAPHDAPKGCEQVIVVPPYDDGVPDTKWEAGAHVSDQGWDARPNRRETYCPRHSSIGADQ